MRTIEKSQAMEQLESLKEQCRLLGAEIDLSYAYPFCFVATAREESARPHCEIFAKAIQREIAYAAKQYPDIICYCFDSFSTLLYIL